MSTATANGASRPDHEVVIVGAGFSGMGAAIKLKEAGFDDYLIVDDADDVGGTWHWNTYPGIAVDIPSFSYQYSFEPRTSWSKFYAPGEELRDYAHHVASKYELRDRIRFRTRITGATYDDEAHLWRLRTREGEEISSRFLIGASGVLTEPKYPDIEGVRDFAGETVHTARWDHTLDLSGKRVGIIGTGASAVQVIPSIAPDVEHLTVFQRTPVWCLPRIDKKISAPVRFVLERVPLGQRALRLLSQSFVELTFPISAHYYGLMPQLTKLLEAHALGFLKHQVRDPEVRAKLKPDYGLGCKRPTFSNDYLATFNRDNVHLETDPIARVTNAAIETEAGNAHEIDVLILATGFSVFERGNTPGMSCRGASGVELEDWWRENRLQAYEGVSVPGFPNLFLVSGPYGYNGSSYFNLVETQTKHIVRCLQRARREAATRVEVRREANERYFAEMLRRRGRQIFWRESCTRANSYYFDEHGDVPLRPVSTLETMWRASRFDLGDYRFENGARRPSTEPADVRASRPATAPGSTARAR